MTALCPRRVPLVIIIMKEDCHKYLFCDCLEILILRITKCTSTGSVSDRTALVDKDCDSETFPDVELKVELTEEDCVNTCNGSSESLGELLDIFKFHYSFI